MSRSQVWSAGTVRLADSAGLGSVDTSVEALSLLHRLRLGATLERRNTGEGVGKSTFGSMGDHQNTCVKISALGWSPFHRWKTDTSSIKRVCRTMNYGWARVRGDNHQGLLSYQSVATEDLKILDTPY